MKTERHIALYRKYRPSEFGDIAGQEKVVSLLKTQIEQNKISHAYLFYGGRGTGKTTTARIFAKEVGSNEEDIIEIDGASNRGIDEIRELREAVRSSPFSSKYKVYIIDEAHMLTKEAANALLKTLEEPPSHVIFILATTDPQKLPKTISSRCQIISLQEPTVNFISERLIHIAKLEKFNLDKEIADIIAVHGNGSYRDAISLLEQILVQSDKKVDIDFVKNYLGQVDFDILYDLVNAICKKDISKITKIINKEEKEGHDAIRFFDNMILFFRNGLLVRAGEEKLIENISEENKNKLIEKAKEFPLLINSQNLLNLLSHHSLIKSAGLNAWTAVYAVASSLIKE